MRRRNQGKSLSLSRKLLVTKLLTVLADEQQDAIEYYSQLVKYLRDKIDQKRLDIDALIRKDRQARKQRKQTKPHGENYGFVTLKTISEAHRIARTHRGRLKELNGARIQLAPSPQDLIWKNVPLEPNVIAGRKVWGFLCLGVICFLHTLPLLFVSLLANLSSVSRYAANTQDAESSDNSPNQLLLCL